MIKLTDDEREQLEQEIISLEWALRATDYKVIKAYEYEMCGIKAPYDIEATHKERQAQRDRINEIKQTLSEEG
jgi:hypothetical protein